MPTRRFIIVCEGQSEWAYLKRLQGFLDDQATEAGQFQPPLIFMAPESSVVKSGQFKMLVKQFKSKRQENRKANIQIWADFDLYHRNDANCATSYTRKPQGIPDFLFSFHNFEDFFALHFTGEQFQDWLAFGGTGGTRHFTTPLHSREYMPEITRVFPNYSKGNLPPDFVTWDSLKTLKFNLNHQPYFSNPHNLTGIPSFAEFLIQEIELAYPGQLE